MGVAAKRWTRKEYHRLAEQRFFAPDELVELVDGELFTVSPQGRRHMLAISLGLAALFSAFGSTFHLRCPGPIEPDERSEPEPDFAVFRGQVRDHVAADPGPPVLVVEVADSSLAHDRGLEAQVYARAGTADYWIVNLVDDVLEVHRDPAPDPGARTGWSYRSITVLAKGEAVAPLAKPEARVWVADLLP